MSAATPHPGAVWHGAPALVPLLAPLASLRPDAENARGHDADDIAGTAASLARFGQQKSHVVVRDADAYTMIAGNGTLAAAARLGWTHIAVAVFEGTAAEARAYAIADNRTAELSAWDQPGLLEDLRALGATDPGLVLAAGFRDDDVASLALQAQDAAALASAPLPVRGRVVDPPTLTPRATLDTLPDDDPDDGAEILCFDDAAVRGEFLAFLAALAITYPREDTPAARFHAFLATLDETGELDEDDDGRAPGGAGESGDAAVF